MSFTKLLKKRGSLKEATVIKSVNEEIEKFKSCTELSLTTDEKLNISGTPVFIDDSRRSKSIVNEYYTSSFEYIETEDGNHTAPMHCRIPETRRQSAPPDITERVHLIQNKNVANSDKKHLSESENSNSEIIEEDMKTSTNLKENHLEELIGLYVNDWIKDSMTIAAQSMDNSDSLYDGTTESLGNEKDTVNSTRSHSIVEKKWSDNLAEYIDVEEEANDGEFDVQKDAEIIVEGQTSENGNKIQPANFETSSDECLTNCCEVALSSTNINLEPPHNDRNEMIENIDISENILTAPEKQEMSIMCTDKTNTESDINAITDMKLLKQNEQSAEIITESSIQVYSNTEGDNRSENTCITETLQTAPSCLSEQNSKTDNQDKDSERIFKDNSETIYENLNEINNESDKIDENVSRESASIISSDKLPQQEDIETNSICSSVKSSKVDNSSDIYSEEETKANVSQKPDDKIEQLRELSSIIGVPCEIDSPVHLSVPSTSESELNISDQALNDNVSKQKAQAEDDKKINWKVGYLHVKLPHKTRSKNKLKAWKKRCVSIQPDEFVNDPKYPSIMISVYSGESGSARKHSASFWKSISCRKSVIYRSSSKTHKYAFTVADNKLPVLHLAADSESLSQEWMSAIRSILWPPSPVIQLEKMLHGKGFEISLIDNDFSLRADLLGMYGYLTITRKKLILVHPYLGYVIQEWYLNTIDKFELMTQSKIEDANKCLRMTTCSDSSTGKGEILMFCSEAVAMLQAIASTIHQILTEHTQQQGKKYEKELSEMADWLTPALSQSEATEEDYYKVPPRQVKSLLDIPNFIFDKPLGSMYSPSSIRSQNTESFQPLTKITMDSTKTSHDSGLSTEILSDDFLDCSSTSFTVGDRKITEKSSDSELSDTYTPPRTPEIKTKQIIAEKQNDDTPVQET